MSHSLIHADLLAHLRGNRWLVQNGYIPKAHAVLSDPPYGLAFMGKHWDTLGTVEFQAWVSEWAELLIDYVYPGAVGLFFGGTRTYHRLAAGLEDAGWEIADCIMWVYGSGFPKSAAIDKLLDKEAGAAREVVGERSYSSPDIRGNSSNGRGISGPENEGRERLNVPITAPATPLAARWEGYGTALKPAWEPCVIARAPRGKRTYAALAREFGTGALAIDAARIGTADDLSGGTYGGVFSGSRNEDGSLKKAIGSGDKGRWPANFALVCACESDEHAPDCPVAVLGEQSGERPGASSNSHKSRNESTRNDVAFHDYGTTPLIDGYGDTGTAARFFYQAKAAAWEREAGLHGFALQENPTAAYSAMKVVNQTRKDGGVNIVLPRRNVHPTVKPIRLAEYLARLILPPALDEPRRLLVPFAGSGSEMIGALLAGWDVVTGIEREAEYVELAQARVGWWAQFATYDEARVAYEKGRKAKPVVIPAPVVIADEKPAQLALFEEEAS